LQKAVPRWREWELCMLFGLSLQLRIH